MAKGKKEESTGGEQMRFEEGMQKLEGIVTRLESGDLALEQALAAFEAGVGLVRLLNEKLTVAEQRVEVLSRGEDGTLQLAALEREES
jgi:exodeoxyribonuclease VII small subunit